MRRLRWIAGLVLAALALALLFAPARALAQQELGECMHSHRAAPATGEWRARAFGGAGCQAWRMFQHSRHHRHPGTRGSLVASEL